MIDVDLASQARCAKQVRDLIGLETQLVWGFDRVPKTMLLQGQSCLGQIHKAMIAEGNIPAERMSAKEDDD